MKVPKEIITEETLYLKTLYPALEKHKKNGKDQLVEIVSEFIKKAELRLKEAQEAQEIIQNRINKTRQTFRKWN